MSRLFLNKIDARLKLIFLMVSSVLFFLPIHIFIQFIIFLLIFFLGIRICGYKNFINTLKVIFPLLILTLILTPLFFRADGKPLLHIGNFILLTDAGIRETSILILRFMGLTSLFYIFFKTTTQDEFIKALRFFGLPFKIALVISISVNYIPLLQKKYRYSEDANKMRKTMGSKKTGKWDFIGKLKNKIPILSAVLIQAVKNISVLAMALEVRGIGRKYCLKIASSAILTSVIVVMTIMIRIPIGPTRGYLNFGDLAIYFSAFTFGPITGFIAGGLGTAIADILSGYSQWALFTFIIHALQGLAIGIFSRLFFQNKSIFLFLKFFFAFLAGTVIMAGGYYLAGCFMIGPGAALAEIPLNIFQNILGAACGYFLACSVNKAYPHAIGF